MNELVTVSCLGDLAHIRMDDGRANALSRRMLTALHRAVTSEVRDAGAVLLSGRASVFCGGLDLNEVVPLPRHEMHAFLDLFHATMRAVFALPRPLVVAASGSAVAGGAVLLCSGDLRLGARDAGVVGLNEAQLGIPLPACALELVAAALPAHESATAMLFGTLYGKEEALRRGFFHHLIAPADLLAEAEQQALRLAGLPRSATSAIKHALRAAALQRMDASYDASHQTFTAAWTSEPAQTLLRQTLESLKSAKKNPRP